MPSTLITLIALGLVIILGGILALLSLTRAFVGGAEMSDRMQLYASIPEIYLRRERGQRRPFIARIRLRMNAMLSAIGSEKLGLQLLQANLPITMTEFIVIRLAGTCLGFLLGWLLGGEFASGIALAVLVYMFPGIYLRRRIHKRKIEFEKQLVDVLVLLSGAVRAGFSLLQALEVVVREMKPPSSDEFQRVITEVGLGLSLSQSLKNLCTRMQNEDLNLLVTVIDIQYQVGGNLTTMLDAVTNTIRERTRLFSEVRVLTTQQRYTGYLLTLLPFFIGALLFLMNPDYMMRLFESRTMLCIPLGALVGIILGNIVIRRITKIDV